MTIGEERMNEKGGEYDDENLMSHKYKETSRGKGLAGDLKRRIKDK